MGAIYSNQFIGYRISSVLNDTGLFSSYFRQS